MDLGQVGATIEHFQVSGISKSRSRQCGGLGQAGTTFKHIFIIFGLQCFGRQFGSLRQAGAAIEHTLITTIGIYFRSWQCRSLGQTGTAFEYRRNI